MMKSVFRESFPVKIQANKRVLGIILDLRLKNTYQNLHLINQDSTHNK